MSSKPLAEIDATKFSELLHSRFRVGTALPAGVELELAEVAGVRNFREGGPGTPEYEGFSLIFQGPDTAPLKQGTHPFEHAQIGKFDLFIVPIARTAGVIQYQAVFNRRLNPA